MRRRHSGFGIPILLALTLIVASCGSEDESTTTTIVATTQAPATTVAPSTPTTTSAPTTTTTTAAPTTTLPALEEISGTFTVALVANLTTSNYWAYLDAESSVHNGYVLGQSQPALYTISVPDFLHIPVLATDVAPDLVLEGNRWTATIALREGYLWSDGVEVTAHDVVFSVNVNGDFGLGSNWVSYHPFLAFDEDEAVRWVERVEALDRHRVKITFAPSERPPGPGVYENGILFHPIMPAHFWDPMVEACETEEDPKACLYAADGTGQPSAGPLTFKSWEPGVGATIVANPTYYYRNVTYTVYDDLVYTQTGGAADLDETFYGEPSGLIASHYTDGPFVEEVRFIEYGSIDAAYQAFLRGDVDYVMDAASVPADLYERLLSEPGVVSAQNPSEGFGYLAFNLREAPMSDLAFRQALAYVLDKEFLTSLVPPQAAVPIYSIIPKQNRLWYTDEVNKWGSGLTEAERFDLAVQVLVDAGYTWTTNPEATRDADGDHTGEFISGEDLIQPGGTPMPVFEVIIPGPSPDPFRQALGEWMVTWGARLGIPVDFRPVEMNTLVGLAFPPTADGTGWDMYGLAWGGGDPSFPCSSHQAFFGADQDAVLFGGFNSPGYNDPEFEALSAALDLAATIDEAREICADMERHISETLPYLVLISIPVTTVWPDYVEFPITDVIGGINGFPNGWLGQVKLNR